MASDRQTRCRAVTDRAGPTEGERGAQASCGVKPPSRPAWLRGCAKKVSRAGWWIGAIRGTKRRSLKKRAVKKWCPEPESNQRHADFQSAFIVATSMAYFKNEVKPSPANQLLMATLSNPTAQPLRYSVATGRRNKRPNRSEPRPLCTTRWPYVGRRT